jgi:Flp pilus assembly protein TadG
MRNSLRPIRCDLAKRGLRRFAADARGVTVIEFAFLAPLYAAFIFGLFEVAIIHFARASLETAAENAARQVLTNQDGGLTQAQFKTRVCANLPNFMSCGSLMVNVQPYTPGVNPYPQFTFDGNGNITNQWAVAPCFATTCAGRQLMVQVMYPWSTISLPLGISFGDLPNGSLLLMSVQIFQVEGQT